VAAAEPVVAGLVILAGGTQPLHWAAVRQVSYLASLEPGAAAASRSVVDAMTRQAEMVDSAELSASTPVTELPFGVPAAYWLDLRGYHPVELAATLGKPMLILQGGRDYQVTVADDLARWRAGLADRTEVSFRVYDRDNHMFFPRLGAFDAGRVPAGATHGSCRRHRHRRLDHHRPLGGHTLTNDAPARSRGRLLRTFLGNYCEHRRTKRHDDHCANHDNHGNETRPDDLTA